MVNMESLSLSFELIPAKYKLLSFENARIGAPRKAGESFKKLSVGKSHFAIMLRCLAKSCMLFKPNWMLILADLASLFLARRDDYLRMASISTD